MKPTLLLVGVGDLGGVLLELLAREPRLGRIVAADRDAGRGAARSNLARAGGVAQGFEPDIRFEAIDLNDVAATAELITRVAPALILDTASPQTWWLAGTLPAPQAALIRKAGFGVWLPINLTLTLKLMQAVSAAHYQGFTLTAPHPDVVNVVLARLGLAPTCGIGNLDEIVPKVRLLASERLGAPIGTVKVWLVAHHALEPPAFAGASGEVAPYFLRIEHHGRDVTGEVEGDELLLRPYPLPPGPAIHFLTGGSTLRLVNALLFSDGTFLHAPAPHGLPGGYPVVAGRAGLSVELPPGLTLEQAVDINTRSHRFDGIERIEEDGTAVFCQESADTLRAVLGYSCDRLAPADAGGRAAELMARFREFAGRHGVDFAQRFGR
jgi:hypothetical protein